MSDYDYREIEQQQEDIDAWWQQQESDASEWENKELQSKADEALIERISSYNQDVMKAIFKL